MIDPGQGLPAIHIMICCPRSTSLPWGKSRSSDHYKIISIPLDFTQIITKNKFKTHLPISGAQHLRSVHIEKSYLDKAGYPVLYNWVIRLTKLPGATKNS